MTKAILNPPQIEKPKTTHERLIRDLGVKYPQAHIGGFKSEVRKLQKRIGVFYDEVWKGGLVPDLWFIDEDCMSLVCIEVEDTSQISKQKMESYCRLWFTLDCYYWEAHLICFSRWGAAAAVPLSWVSQPDEVGKNLEMFKLSKVYAMSDTEEREAARANWMAGHPAYLKANFYAEQRLERRMTDRGISAYTPRV